MKYLITIVNEELKDNENIFILKEKDVDRKKGIMEEYTDDELFNVYSKTERVKKYWHEDGLCIVIK